MVRCSLTLEAAKTLVHAFISSRLDYYNNLLYEISDGMLAKLQTVQNAAARVVTGTRKFDHQCCINFTGFRCVSESPSSAFVVWRRLTCPTCASPFRRSSAGRLTAGHLSCHVPGLRSVGETLLCRATRPWSGPATMEQPPRRTADFITVFSDVCEKKTQRSFIRLLAPLKTFV